MVCGIAGLVSCGLASIVGLVLGFVAKSRINRSNGQLGGKGMAIAGIVLGFVALAFLAFYAIVIAFAFSGDSGMPLLRRR
jgi:uncharacterized membrane protein